MYSPLSPLWDKAVRSSHVVDVQVDAFDGASGPKTAAAIAIDPEGGMITADLTADVRKTVELTVTDRSLLPVTADSVLAPHGTELHIRRGFRYPNGTIERVPVGTFRIDKPAAPIEGGGIRISGVDRSRLVQDDKFIYTAQSLIGAKVVDEIKRLIQQTIPRQAVFVLTDDDTICPPVIWEQGTSRWDAVQDLALSINCDLFVSAEQHSGFYIKPMATLATPPVWRVNIGEDGVLIGGSEQWDRDNVYNAVTARGEPTDGSSPVQATVYDLDPDSPTYWNSSFGHRPRVYSSPLLWDVASCTAAAKLILRRSIIPARSVTVSCAPNPALELTDVVTLVLPGLTEASPPREENLMIHGYRLPLGLGPMELDLVRPDPGDA